MRVQALTLTTAAVIITTAAAATASATTGFTPGAATAGDSYLPLAGDGGYLASHYALNLDYVPGTGRLTATSTMAARATQNLSRFDVDLRGLTVSKVTVDGVDAGFTRHGRKLAITPRTGLPADTTFSVTVTYHGIPGPAENGPLGTYGWVRTPAGAVVTSEPDGASTWFPVNDTPRDKASYNIAVTVPNGLTVLANGVRTSVTTGRTTTTSTWLEDRPMASYLATVAIGRFVVRSGSTRAGIPIITGVDPTVTKHSTIYERTATATDWEARIFGRYPFSSTGGIIASPGLGYALETQTRPVYAGFEPDTVTLVHELAHQWFGDSVTLGQWKDIWLNEGFATFTEWLWTERHGGQSAAAHFSDLYHQPGNSPTFDVPPGDPGVAQLFGPAVYDRGAMTLQALRARVGDQAFFAILHDWASRYRYRTVTTADFVSLADEVSGRNLDGFFRTWLYTKGKPTSW
jgi:aminopeptidase N